MPGFLRLVISYGEKRQEQGTKTENPSQSQIQPVKPTQLPQLPLRPLPKRPVPAMSRNLVIQQIHPQELKKEEDKKSENPLHSAQSPTTAKNSAWLSFVDVLKANEIDPDAISTEQQLSDSMTQLW